MGCSQLQRTFLLAESAPCSLALETFSESEVLLPHYLSHLSLHQLTLGFFGAFLG